MTSFIPSFLEVHKTIAEQTGRAFHVKRPPRQLHPKGVERMFGADLVRIIEAIKADIDEQLMPEIARLVRLSGTRGDDTRHDIEDISAILDTILGRLTVRVSNTHLRDLEQLVQGYFNDTSSFSRRQTFRQIRRMIGVDVFPREGQLQVMLNTFKRENVSLITSLAGNYVDDVANIVRRRVRAGDRPSVIEKDLTDRFAVTKNKAKLIARDQTNKLNGVLTKMRQTDLGIEEYIWRTSRDERVRSKHLEREGRVFRWDDPPMGGHPGQAIQCRCSAEPVIEGAPAPRESRREVIREVELKRETLRKRLKGKKGKAAARARGLIAR